jgi:hypothetical protein
MYSKYEKKGEIGEKPNGLRKLKRKSKETCNDPEWIVTPAPLQPSTTTKVGQHVSFAP